MADNRAKDTSDITTRKTNPRLLKAIIALLGPSQRPIDHANCLFERCELRHRIRDLSRPQRVQPLIQARHALLRNDLTPALAQGTCVRR